MKTNTQPETNKQTEAGKQTPPPGTIPASPAPAAEASAAPPANGVTTPFMQDQQALSTVSGKLTRKRRLTVDVTNISKLGELLALTQSDLYTRELPSTFHPSGKATVYCVDVVNVLTGEEYMLACNTVLASALQRAGTPLAGRYFAIRCGEIVAGKRYRRVDVVELERAE